MMEENKEFTPELESEETPEVESEAEYEEISYEENVEEIEND